jgi:prepilin-type N-terminal cleavage/methylation domain-containing protein
MVPRAQRRAFTLIELLVVVAIIAVLMMLLLPAVQRVREAANKARCMSNLRQVGLAMHMYHHDMGHFPPAQSGRFQSCFTLILPYVEQEPIARRYDPSLPPTVPPNSLLANQPLQIFLCPSMGLPAKPPHPSYSSYGACVGKQFAWGHAYPPGTYPPHDGIIIPLSQGTVRVADVRDGTSMTFLVGEMHYNVMDYLYTSGPDAGQVRGGNTSWVWGYPSYSFGSTLVMMNTKTHTGPLTASGIHAFRSDHTNSCNFLFADHSVRPINNGIDLPTYQALSTRAGQEVVAGDY